ncbi:MAG: nucleotidyltransferase domain-containing protein [Candidatus Woesearchaeota archaeon]
MEFKINQKANPHVRKYSQEDLDTAREFAKKAYKEFGTFCKAVVLFGSAARKNTTSRMDIDIMVVVNDLTIELSPEAVEAYRIIMQRLVGETNRRIHLTTLKFTNFWDLVRKGDPIAINILRDGVALLDTGFFDPIQALLYDGKIRPTYESIYTYLMRAPTTVQNSKMHIMQATVDLYWAVIDAAHAALMKHGEIPPSPAHVADMIEDKLVKPGIIEARYAHIMKNFYGISRKIMHREIQEVTGTQYEKHLKDAEDFVSKMKQLVEK